MSFMVINDIFIYYGNLIITCNYIELQINFGKTDEEDAIFIMWNLLQMFWVICKLGHIGYITKFKEGTSSGSLVNYSL